MLSLVKRITLFSLLLAIATAITLPVHAAEMTLSSAINKAGRQRMLSQRIVKAYAQVAQDVQYGVSQSQLDGAIKLFEEQLAELVQFSPNEGVGNSLSEVALLWVPFKEAAQNPDYAASIPKLVELNEPLLKAAHQVVLRLQETAGTETARLVNVSGRQRMLSQRIAKFYMLLSMGDKTPGLAQEMQSARYEFEGALADLIASPQNTIEIAQALKEVEKQWVVFKKSFQLSESGQYVPLLVAMASEKVLRLMNEITGMYEQLSAR